jgi:hypothetical protein
MEGAALVEAWRGIIRGPDKSWVLSANGTCVILMEPEDDLARQATELLREWGPVHVGSSAADFGIIELRDGQGWAVNGHHNDILTYVAPDEVEPGSTDLVVGLLGRSRRDQDAEELRVPHVEDRHGGGTA